MDNVQFFQIGTMILTIGIAWGSLKSSMNHMQDDIKDIKSEVKTIKTDVSTLKTDVAALKVHTGYRQALRLK